MQHQEPDPFWKNLVPDFRHLTKQELASFSDPLWVHGWKWTTVIVDMPMYMQFLMTCFLKVLQPVFLPYLSACILTFSCLFLPYILSMHVLAPALVCARSDVADGWTPTS